MESADVDSRKRNRRIVWISIAVIAIVAVAAVAYIAIEALAVGPTPPVIGQPVATAVLSDLTGVTDSTLSTVGAPSSVGAPQTISGTPLTLDGKPEVLYIGGEYCPFCGFERWAMIVALSRFGNFTGLEYMLSSASDTNPNTPTFTFSNATFTSQYIAFVPVEAWNRAGQLVQQPTSAQQALFTQYNPTGGIPFVDLGNSYLLVGAQSTIDISGDNWIQISSQLNNPPSLVAQSIDGAANYLITAICKIDGAQPSSVCSQPYANLPLTQVTGVSQDVQSDAEVPTAADEPRWVI